MINFSFKKLLSTVLAVLFVVPALAQITTSSLGGRVTDQNGEPVPGVAVVATHTPSGTTYGVITNNDGRYAINGMRAGGPYEVEISSLGYQTSTYTGVVLQLGETYSLNANIKEEALTLGEAMVIATPASKFATEKTGASTNINNSQIEALPTISRSITDITKLSPYGGNGMSFAGTDSRTANFTVDGANFNNNFGLSGSLPGGGSPISIDAIEEMQVVISPYDVRQNNFVGGGVNAITKSGTNKFKGTAYAYHRNENMRGNMVAGTEVAGARDKDRNTTYGFTLGGPIIKNKLFFFVNFERSTIPTVVNSWRASKDGVGNADAHISRTTEADLEKVKKYLMDNYGYDTGSYTDFPADETNTKILGRIDWNISRNHHLALRYNSTVNTAFNNPNASSSNAGQRTTESRVGLYGFSYANSMYSMNNKANTFSLDLNSRLSNNLSNELLVTYSDLSDLRGSTSKPFPFIDILNGDDYAAGSLMPYISAGYELFTWKNAVHNQVLTAKDDIILYLGAHKIMGGVSYDYQLADNAYMRNGTGYYRYKSLDDFLNKKAPETVALTYGYDGNQDPASRVRFHKVAAYAQDEWNPGDKLKLVAGLRLETILFDNQDLMTNKKIYDTDYNGINVDTGKWPTPKLMLNPRLGFTYDVLGDHSLKIRGGTGIFTGRLPLVFFTNMPTNAGLVQMVSSATTRYSGGTTVNTAKTDQAILDAFAGKDIFADAGDLLTFLNGIDPAKYPLSVSPEDGTFSGSIAAVDPKFKMPQVWKTSLAIDYAFPTNFPLSITGEFIFNKTINGVRIRDINMKETAGFARLNGADRRHIFPADYTYNKYSVFYLTNTNKGYGGTASFQINTKPVKGLDINAAYTRTWSKELTGMPGSDASSAFTYIPTVDGPNNPILHNSSYVTPDRFYVNLSYTDKAANNFGIFYTTWRGGYNYSYMYDNDLNGDNYNYDAIYIPTEQNYADGLVKFDTADDAQRFFDFAKKDAYLSKHAGEYAEAYSVYNPWVHRVDFHYSHDFGFKVAGSKNVLRLSVDIQNAMNLFNNSWGVSKQMNPELKSGRILKVERIGSDGIPVLSTPKAVSGNTKTWTDVISIGQAWYAQVGIKYIFN